MHQSEPDAHWLDRLWVYVNFRLKLYPDGWGPDDVVPQLEARGDPFVPPPAARVQWLEPPRRGRTATRRAGRFETPFSRDLLPAESHHATFEMITPAGSDRAPVCIHLAGVGDEGYALRRYFAMPLLRHGIGSVILENPFYGVRRPARQRGIALRRVTDQFVMNMASVEEACALLVWLRERGHAAAGLTGHSMGGYMAALAAVVFPEPVAVMSCATGLSAAPVFTDGLLSRYIDWDLLANGHNVEDAKARLRDLFNLASLSRFEPPKKPSAAVLLAAQTDGYVPPSSVRALHAHWPGSQLRWMPGGHVRAVTRRRLMAQAVADAFGALG